jgi:hypothetical protein
METKPKGFSGTEKSKSFKIITPHGMETSLFSRTESPAEEISFKIITPHGDGNEAISELKIFEKCFKIITPHGDGNEIVTCVQQVNIKRF